LLIPYLFAEYDKVIYLDGDMLCFVDIAELYKTELFDNLLAVVRDVGVSWYYSPNHSQEKKGLYEVLLQLKKPEDYFCDGMCIMNTKLFREAFTMKELLDIAVSREWPIFDQDVFNFLCEGKVLLLPFFWDYMRTSDSKYLPENLKSQYLEAEANPKIIHFKPWTIGNYSPYLPYSEYFWKYAARTSFYDIIISRMKEKELLLSHPILSSGNASMFPSASLFPGFALYLRTRSTYDTYY
jgi:lipopolysaccharide biosynthesis glycosyltransferase